MHEWKRENKAVKAITEMRDVGLLAATAGREFAAWSGLAPKQTGSDRKVNSHGISKRGDAYQRTLLIDDTRNVLTNVKDAGLGSSE